MCDLVAGRRLDQVLGQLLRALLEWKPQDDQAVFKREHLPVHQGQGCVDRGEWIPPRVRRAGALLATEGPSWGYPMLVLGTVCSFLEPFRGHLSPKVIKIFKN